MSDFKTKHPYTYYNWQFLRRNPEYRLAYNNYENSVKDSDKQDSFQAAQIYTNWGLREPQDWNLELPENLSDSVFEAITTLGIYSYNQILNSEIQLNDITELSTDSPTEPKHLLIAIDLNRFSKKEYDQFYTTTLKSIFNDFIGTAKRVQASHKRMEVLLATYDTHISNPNSNPHQLLSQLRPLYETDHTKDADLASFTKQYTEALELAKQYIKLAPRIPFNFTDEN